MERRQQQHPEVAVVGAVDVEQAVAEQPPQVREATLAPLEGIELADQDLVVDLSPDRPYDRVVQDPNREHGPVAALVREQHAQRIGDRVAGVGPTGPDAPGRPPRPAAPDPHLTPHVVGQPREQPLLHRRGPRGADRAAGGQNRSVGHAEAAQVSTGSSSRCGLRKATETASPRRPGPRRRGSIRMSSGPGVDVADRTVAVLIQQRAADGVPEHPAVGGAVAAAPAQQRAHHRPQLAAGLGQLVEVAPAVARVGPSVEDPVLHESAETIGQHGLGNIEMGLEIAEPAYAEEGVADDQQRPALADHLQRARHRAVLSLVVLAEHALIVAGAVR